MKFADVTENNSDDGLGLAFGLTPGFKVPRGVEFIVMNIARSEDDAYSQHE
jgi:hypothetical protein